MKSMDYLFLGMTLIFMAMVLHVGHFILNDEVETNKKDVFNQYLNDDIPKETYDEQMNSLNDLDYYYDRLELANTIVLYAGISVLFYAVYRKVDAVEETNDDESE